MIPFASRLRAADPGRAFFHRALRVALVLPVLLWLGLHVAKDTQFALFASFGSFAALGMADFMGPARSRLLAYAVLGAAGALLATLGTALSQTLWPAVVAMLVIGIAGQFVMALGGQFALGNNAGVLAFVVAVMVPADPEAIGPRVAGWLTAIAASALVASLLWPRHERRDLYVSMAVACGAIAAASRAAADRSGTGASRESIAKAIDDVDEIERALSFRPIGPPQHQRALLGIADGLAQSARLVQGIDGSALDEPDRTLARAAASSLEGIAGVMAACAQGRAAAADPLLASLSAARHGHRVALEEQGRVALHNDGAASSVVASFARVFPLRVLSYAVLSMGVDALVVAGRPVRVADDFAVIEPAIPRSAWRNALDLLRPHLAWRSVCLHNSARAGAALALSVMVAKVMDIGHAFWVVLATLAVLRSNSATTGATVVSAVAGTLAGFVLATIAIALLGPHPVLMWITLPLAVFLAAYAPYAVSFAAGQAMFALLVIELFNLMVPEGWQVGVARVEAVLVGALVAFVASLIMWPKGAGAVLRAELAAHLRQSARLFRAAFDAVNGGDAGSARALAAHRDAAAAARHRAEEAFASFIGERGVKRVPLSDWGRLARAPLAVDAAADAAIAMHRAGVVGLGEGDAHAAFVRLIQAMDDAMEDFAARLAGERRAPGAAIRGKPRDALLAAVDAYLRTHRDDPHSITRTMAWVFGACWAEHLGRVLEDAEPALGEVVAASAIPWWR